MNDYIEDTSVRLIINLGVGYSAEKEKGEAILKPLRLARRFLFVFIVVSIVVFPFLVSLPNFQVAPIAYASGPPTPQNMTLINAESFEGTWPPTGWTENPSNSYWNKESDSAYAGSYSADFNGTSYPSRSGDLDTPSLNCSGATYIYVEFWWMDTGLDNDDFLLKFYDGSNWDTIQDMNLFSHSENVWTFYSLKVTDNQYFVSTFKVRWSGVTVSQGEHIYVDVVTVKKETTAPYTPPVWSNAGTNNTVAGEPTLFHVKWTDDVGLSGFIFGTNNTGTWVNDTWTPMSGSTNWSNVTKILNSAVGATVQWRVWANDTSNNWSDTGILALTTIDPEPTLTTILDRFGFTHRNSSSAQTFSAGTYNITLYAEFAGYCYQNNLSYYQVGTSVYNTIFTGPEGGNGYVTPPLTKTFTINYAFGLSFATPENHRYWTENTRTPNDGLSHCKIYENLDVPGMYLIGWENTWGGGDKDYNDMVLSLCPQYQVTFNQTGVSTDFTGNVVTIDGTGYTRANLPKSFWWNKYSIHSFSFTSPLNVNAGKRYVWNSTSGLSTLQSGTLTVTSSGSVTGNYKTQYYLIVNTNPAEVLTLNPSAVSGQGWYYSGTTATVDAVQVVSKVAGQSRYDFRSWTGATPTGVGNKATVLMNGPKTATANYQLQYNITFCQTGVGSDFSGTVVSIDSTNYNRAALPVSFWWDNGTSHNFAFQSPLVVTSNAKQYVWNTTSGLSSSQSGSITVSTSGSVTGNYKTQYYLTVSNGGHGTATGEGWYYAGSSASFSISPTTVPGGTGTQYVFTGWIGSGTGSYTGPDASHSVTMNNPITETAQWKTQYKLTVFSAHDSPVPSVGEHWYDAGTPITASVTSPADQSGGTRYRCTGWTGTGSVPSSGTGTTVNFNINQASNITWNWIAQYYLTVTSPYGTTGGQNWYDSGTNAYATLTTGLVDHGNGTRRVFVRWNGDASGTDYAQSNSILMDGPKTATAVWKTQYKLTVRTSGLGTKVTNVYNGSTILGTATDATPYTGWFDQNAVIQLDIDSPINGNPMKYVFIKWTGDASGSDRPTPVTMNLPKDITANYKTQYEVTFTQSGLDSSATGVVVTVNGTTKTFGQLPYVFWVDSGTVITYSYSNVSSSTPGKRFILTGVTGPASPITVTSSVTVTGNYKTQYQITVTASPSGAIGGTFKVTYTQCGTVYTNVQKTTSWTEWVDASTTVTVSEPQDIINGPTGTRYKFDHYDPSDSVTMDQAKTITLVYKTQYKLTVVSAHDSPVPSVGEHWYDTGTFISASVTSPADESGGTRYRCTGWTGTGSVPSSGTGTSVSFTINQPSSITWNWIAQYYLTVTSPYDSPNPISGWFDTGTSITASVTSPWAGTNGVRYVCTGWTGTGSVPASGSAASVTFTINQASSITWNWKTQYYLTVKTDPTGLSPAPTPPSGWYDKSQSVQLTAPAVIGYTFDYWDVDGTSQGSGVNPISVPMDNPHTATAHYKKAAPPPVGGYALPINLDLGTSNSLLPQIGLASALSATVAATIILVKRRKYALRREH